MKTFVIIFLCVAASNGSPVDSGNYDYADYEVARMAFDSATQKFATALKEVFPTLDLLQFDADKNAVLMKVVGIGGTFLNHLFKALAPAIRALPANDLKVVCLEISKLLVEALDFLYIPLHIESLEDVEEGEDFLADQMAVVAQHIPYTKEGYNLYESFIEFLVGLGGEVAVHLHRYSVVFKNDVIPGIEAMPPEVLREYLLNASL